MARDPNLAWYQQMSSRAVVCCRRFVLALNVIVIDRLSTAHKCAHALKTANICYVASRHKVKPVIPHLRKEEGETTTNDQEVADVPGKFFESVFTMEDDGDNILLKFENRVPENKVLNEITFTELDIFIKLQQLKEDKACGPKIYILKHNAWQYLFMRIVLHQNIIIYHILCVYNITSAQCVGGI